MHACDSIRAVFFLMFFPLRSTCVCKRKVYLVMFTHFALLESLKLMEIRCLMANITAKYSYTAYDDPIYANSF